MVLGLFALCYLPVFVSVILSIKIGPSQVPVALRDTVVVLIGVHSTVNPIIYMLRSKEFKRAFLKFFTSGPLVSRVETMNTHTTRFSASRLPLSVSYAQTHCSGLISEAPLKVNVPGGLVPTYSTHLSHECCQDDRRPSFLAVPTQDLSSPRREKKF